MTESLAAKGPWYVSGTRTRHNSMPVLQIISEPTGEVLALVPYSDRNTTAHKECYADARLIAAAPDLLAVVKEYVTEEWDHMTDEELAHELSLGNEMVRNHIAARAAIARAEGRSDGE